MQFLSAFVYHTIAHADMFWFNPDALHAFRPHESLLTHDYADYIGTGEQPQLQRWKDLCSEVQARARERERSEAERTGEGELSPEELELRASLSCGPLPSAGFVQERVLQRMPTQSGLIADGRAAAQRAAAPAKKPRREVSTAVQTTVPPLTLTTRSRAEKPRQVAHPLGHWKGM